MLALRKYQSNTVGWLQQQRKRASIMGRPFRVCLEAPTGSGKRIMMIDDLRHPRRQLVLCHRTILLNQAIAELTSWRTPHGVIGPGYKPNLLAPIQIGMTQTILRRAGRMKLHDFDDVHIDELHAQRGPKYRDLIDRLWQGGANIIGWSATPSNLGGVVDDVVRIVSVPDLIKQGYMRPPRVFSCGQPDLKKLEKLRRDAYGEFVSGDVEKLVQPQLIFGSVFQNYNRLTNGSAFFLFAHGVKPSIWWAQSLTAKGLPTAHIDGDDVWVGGKFYKSDSDARKAVFERTKPGGDLKGISNRFVLREGVDCPWIGHVILTAPVGSRTSFVQMCGRARADGQAYYIVQDHSGSCLSHPPLDSVEPWDWQSPPGLAEKTHIAKMRSETIPEPIVCPKCMGQRMMGAVCPFCGFQYAKRCRFVQQVDGTLRLVEGKLFPQQRITRRPDDTEVWKRLYFGTIKHGNRTAEQARAYFAFSNNWRWLPRDLPLMPKAEADWFVPLRSVPRDRLYK